MIFFLFNETFHIQFREINRAYNVLINPKTRSVYDKYGDRGIFLLELLGGNTEILQLLPVINNIALIYFMGICFWALLTLIPIFLVIRIENAVTWNWAIVFLPMWLLDLIILGVVGALLIYSSESRSQISLTLFNLVCIFVFQVMLAINLNHYYDYLSTGHSNLFDWVFVFAPIFLLEFVHLMLNLYSCRPAAYRKLLEQVPLMQNDNNDSKYEHLGENENELPDTENFGGLEHYCGYFGFFLRNLVSQLLRIWFWCTLVARLEYDFVNWWIVSIPVFCFLAWRFFASVIDQCHHASLSSEEGGMFGMSAGLCVSICCMILPITFVSLIFAGIQGGGSISSATIFVPVWIVCGILFCCCCFCLPSALMSSKQQLQDMIDEAEKQAQQQQQQQYQQQDQTQQPPQQKQINDQPTNSTDVD